MDDVLPAADDLSKFSLLRSLAIGFLLLLSLLYLAKGYHSLIVSPADLHRRWVECRFVLHGQDPFQMHLHNMHGPDQTYNKRECDRLAAIYGSPEEPVYPPWAYAPAILFVWPPMWLVSIYYGLIDTACIAIIVAGTIVISRPKRPVDAIGVGVGTLAIASICTTLGNGNFGLIVTAAVLLSFFFNERKQPVISGIFFWIALMKPTISLPFAIIFLLRKQWKPLIVAACLSALCCLLPWLVDHVNPVEMTREAIVSSRHFQFGGYGLVNYLSQMGVSNPMVTPVAAMIVLVPTATFFLLHPGLPLWKNLAILAVVGRFWGYHMAHDNIMLLFLFCAACRVFLANAAAITFTLLLLVGFSLWLPSSWTEREWIGIIQHLIWLGSAIFLATHDYQPQSTRLKVAL